MWVRVPPPVLSLFNIHKEGSLSRSRKKNAAGRPRSEKWNKKICHKKFRQAERQALFYGVDPPETNKEVFDNWDMSEHYSIWPETILESDEWYSNLRKKIMRK